jgi:hypothetical protein
MVSIGRHSKSGTILKCVLESEISGCQHWKEADRYRLATGELITLAGSIGGQGGPWFQALFERKSA